MSNSISTQQAQPGQQYWRAEARRWVRRQRILYTMLGIYAVLSLMWFVIDMADGTENLWFFWPMFGTGIVVAVISVVLLGIGGLFGADWETRQFERYRQRYSDTDRPE
jgi:2TM domain